MGDSLEQKLGVRYIGGVEEKERRKKKRKEAFQSQIKACVKLMQVLQPEIIVFIGHWLISLIKEEQTLKYEPGRKLNLGKAMGKGVGRREQRSKGIPLSFRKLDDWLKVKIRKMEDYVRETTCEAGEGHVAGEDMEFDDGDLEQPGEDPEVDVVGDSGDEEEFSDNFSSEDSDSD